MAQFLEMPRLSDTMQEGRVVKWSKKEGDKIAPGDVLAEVETDKATMDFESFDEGVLLKILIGDGGTAPVGGPVAIIGKAGEDISALLAQADGKKAAPATKKEERKQTPAPAAVPTEAAPPKAAAPVQTIPARPSASPPPTRPAPAAAARPAAAPSNGGGAPGVFASPLARRIAHARGIDIGQVAGSGPQGRVVRRDVESWQGPPAAGRAGAPAAPATPRMPAVAGGEDAEQPLSMMRKTIARRMAEAKREIPHFYLTSEIDMDAAVDFRKQVLEALGIKVSYNDLVIKACALALRKVPLAGASWAEDRVILHGGVHIGVAVAIEDGLITPVIHDADAKSLGAIAREIAELAGRARERKLKPEEYTGATFTVSNLGMFGVHHFQAIVNPPEVCILAVGALVKQPVVKDDAIVIGHRMSVTLSCDHRVVDGAVGAQFLQEVVRILEHPMTLAM
jgi:pyruvate dehydrogenase E2 component (dihydrolipoamide acetyltransferase)